MLAAAACSIAPGSSGADPTASTETTELAPSPEAGGPPLLPEELDWSNLDPDPIVGLPSTEANDRLVVLASSERRTDLVLIDLDREPAVPVKRPSHIGTDIAVSETSVAYTIGERTLGFIDVRRPDLTIEAPLPADVPGLIWDVLGDPLGFVVITVPAPAERPGGPDDPGVIVLYDPAGNLSCVTEARVDWFDVDLFGGVLRTDNLATEIERTDCSTGPGLKDAGEDAVMVGTVDGDPLVAALGAVVRYDSATARRKAASEPLGDHVSSILVTDDAVWAIADGFVLKIDPATLEVVHRAGPLDCDGSPYLLDGGGSLWVIDDCTGILAEVDSLTGNYVEAWWFPTDGMSDQEIPAAPAVSPSTGWNPADLAICLESSQACGLSRY
jgi:hypothetical protein